MKLIQTPNQVSLEDIHLFVGIDIKFSGSFILDLNRGIKAIIDKNVLRISFRQQPPNDMVFRYQGNLNIISTKGMDKNDEEINIAKKTISDEIDKITSKWDSSTKKYEGYNQSLKAAGNIQTLISYEVSGKKIYRNAKGKRIEEKKLNSHQKSVINRIRGNHDIK